MMKRIVAVLLSVMLLLSLCASAMAAESIEITPGVVHKLEAFQDAEGLMTPARRPIAVSALYFEYITHYILNGEEAPTDGVLNDCLFGRVGTVIMALFDMNGAGTVMIVYGTTDQKLYAVESTVGFADAGEYILENCEEYYTVDGKTWTDYLLQVLESVNN